MAEQTEVGADTGVELKRVDAPQLEAVVPEKIDLEEVRACMPRQYSFTRLISTAWFENS